MDNNNNITTITLAKIMRNDETTRSAYAAYILYIIVFSLSLHYSLSKWSLLIGVGGVLNRYDLEGKAKKFSGLLIITTDYFHC